MLEAAGVGPEALLGTVGTGYGRASIARAGRKVTEITCHARGAHALDPACRTVIDIGGQDSKVIRLDARGRVVDFAMNDRCAAGTGRFLEVMAAHARGAARADGRGRARGDAHGAHQQRLHRVRRVRGRRADRRRRVAAEHRPRHLPRDRRARRRHGGPGRARAPGRDDGGVALNRAVVAALEEKLGIPVAVPALPQIVGALGAALLAREGEADRG